MIHELKTWLEPFRAIRSGAKTFELRRNDRSYRAGDILVLREWDREGERYTGEFEVRFVPYMTSGGEWGLPRDICVMALVHVSEKSDVWRHLARRILDDFRPEPEAEIRRRFG